MNKYKNTKRIKPTPGIKLEVALNSPTIIEDLPFPYVHYPNHYGTFFTFSENENSKHFFCLCNKDAIENHFKLRNAENDNNWGDSKIFAGLSNHFFSDFLSEQSKTLDIKEILSFRDRLCHRCNLKTPSLRYCHEMYGGNFKQYFGWYINLNSFKLGVRGINFIENYTPNELSKHIKELQLIRSKIDFTKIHFDDGDYLNIKESTKIERKIHNFLENITREEFGFRKIGEGNISESILINIVKSLFPLERIEVHYRPKWLEGLELDIFIPSMKIGIEYQGQQHFYPIKAWGGEKALQQVRERDEKKRKICINEGIKLIEIDYTEPLEQSYIKEKLEI